MSRNHLNVSDLMEELEEIERTTRFDVSELMGALEYIEKNPDMPKEEAVKIKQKVETGVKELRRSVRIAEVKEKKASAAAAPARRNTTRNHVKPNTKSAISRNIRHRRTRNNKNKNKSAHSVRAIVPKSKTRNARNKAAKPNSEKSTGAAKGKSLYEQATYIVENAAHIQNSTNPHEHAYYKKQHATLVEFIRNYGGNTHIELLKKAVAVLKSNPAV